MGKMTLQECLQDLCKREDIHNSLIECICTLPGMEGTDRRVKRWFKGEHLPKGLNAIRMMVVLEMLDYEVRTKIERCSEAKMAAEYFTLGMISTKSLEEVLARDIDPIRRMLLGKISMPDEVRFRIDDHLSQRAKRYSEERRYWESIFLGFFNNLEEGQDQYPDLSKRKGIREVIASTKVPESLQQEKENNNSATHIVEDLQTYQEEQGNGEKTSQEEIPDSNAYSGKHEEVLESLAHLVRASLPLAKMVHSEEFSSEERKSFRNLAGYTELFRLKNILNSLCSES